MPAEREIDVRVAEEIFGHKVYSDGEALFERTESEDRPLRHYSREIQFAWLVAEKMRVSLIPVENNNWFAFVDPQDGWSSPDSFLDFLKKGDFSLSGASVGSSAALAICESALVANQKKKAQAAHTAPVLEIVRDSSEISQEGEHSSFLRQNKDDSSIIH